MQAEGRELVHVTQVLFDICRSTQVLNEAGALAESAHACSADLLPQFFVCRQAELLEGKCKTVLPEKPISIPGTVSI